MSNRAANAVAYVKGANTLVSALVGIFVVIVVGLVVYWIYQAVNKSRNGDDMNPILVDGAIDASDPKNALHWDLPISSSTNSPNLAFTLSFWMYISDWNYRYGYAKALFVKGANGFGLGDACPGLWLGAKSNRLIVATRTQNQGNLELCNIDNIPLQKWVHVAYVLDNRVVDTYINGKLERSCVLSGVPLLNNSDLFMIPPSSTGGETSKDVGFLGQLSSVRYFSRSLRPVDVARLYSEGPHSTRGAGSKSDNGNSTNSNTSANCPTPPPSQIVLNAL